MTALPVILVIIEPDLGTAMVLVPQAIVGAFLAGIEWMHAAVIVAFLVLLVPVGWHFFFFSSRRRHTRCGRDWSSDMCSSDLWPSCATPRRNQAVIGSGKTPTRFFRQEGSATAPSSALTPRGACQCPMNAAFSASTSPAKESENFALSKRPS